MLRLLIAKLDQNQRTEVVKLTGMSVFIFMVKEGEVILGKKYRPKVLTQKRF